MPGKKSFRAKVTGHPTTARKDLKAILFWVLLVLCAMTVSLGFNNTALADTNSLAAFQQILTSTPNQEGAIYHQVQPGESAWTIADSYNIRLGELQRLNNLTDEYIIVPGELLLIGYVATPTPTPSPLSTSQEESLSQTLTPVTPSPGTEVDSMDSDEPEAKPAEATHQVPAFIGGTTMPRSTLLTAFIVIGVGLLALAVITILTNFRRL